MTASVETTGFLRSARPAPRRKSRVDVAISAIGVMAYSFVIWLMVFALLPMLAGFSPTVVSSGSMSPLLRPGDVVLTADHPGTGLGPGTVILFQTTGSDTPVMHRIISVEPDGSYRTRGDANGHADSTPVRPQDVVGVARILVPYAGLPAHWLRVGAWPQLAAFVALITLAASMARRDRRPGRRTGIRSSIHQLAVRRRGISRTAADAADGRVHINTAGVAELQELPGIGPVLAERICRHRDSSGPFAAIEDLLGVTGIAESRLAVFRDAVRVS